MPKPLEMRSSLVSARAARVAPATAIPPRRVMNSRRFIRSPHRRSSSLRQRIDQDTDILEPITVEHHRADALGLGVRHHATRELAELFDHVAFAGECLL